MKTVCYRPGRFRGYLVVLATIGLGVTGGIAADLWVAPAVASQKLNPTSADVDSIAQGKKLYSQACMACHGVSGKGNGPAAAALNPKPGNLTDMKMWTETDGAIFWKISEGKSPMPSFRSALTEAQRWALVNYVRTLAPKSDPKVVLADKGSSAP